MTSASRSIYADSDTMSVAVDDANADMYVGLSQEAVVPGDTVTFRISATRHGVVRSVLMLIERGGEETGHECFLRIFLSAWQQLSILHAQVDLRVDVDASLIALDSSAIAPLEGASATPRGGSPRPGPLRLATPRSAQGANARPSPRGRAQLVMAPAAARPLVAGDYAGAPGVARPGGVIAGPDTPASQLRAALAAQNVGSYFELFEKAHINSMSELLMYTIAELEDHLRNSGAGRAFKISYSLASLYLSCFYSITLLVH